MCRVKTETACLGWVIGSAGVGGRRALRGATVREVVVGGGLLVFALGIAVPFFIGKQAETTRQISYANLQNWGIALNLFVNENDNRLPETGDDFPRPEQRQAWFNALPTYLSMTPLTELPDGELPEPGRPSLFVCPLSRMPSDGSGPYFFSYAMNRHLQPDPKKEPFRVYQLRNPGRTVFLVEVCQFVPWATVQQIDYRQTTRDGEVGAFVLFVDGSVRLLSRRVIEADAETEDARVGQVVWPPFPQAPKPPGL